MYILLINLAFRIKYYLLIVFLTFFLCFWLTFQGGSKDSLDYVKWHPGHYVSVDTRVDTLDFLNRHSDILFSNHIQGILKKMYWGDLEIRPGEYDFSELDSILHKLEEHNKYLFLLVLDRSFVHGCSPGTPMPNYIFRQSNGRYRAALSNGRNGCSAAVWDPWVMNRFILLMRALGSRYDLNPNFHGLSTPESALDTEVRYDKNKYKKQFIRLYKETRHAFPHSLILANLNYLTFDGISSESNLMDIAQVVESEGGGISTPDSVPSRDTPFNFVAEKFKGKLAIAPRADSVFIDLQLDTPFVINNFNIERLGASFIFWANWHRDQPNYLESTVIPSIREMNANPNHYSQLVSQCPSSLSCS